MAHWMVCMSPEGTELGPRLGQWAYSQVPRIQVLVVRGWAGPGGHQQNSQAGADRMHRQWLMLRQWEPQGRS